MLKIRHPTKILLFLSNSARGSRKLNAILERSRTMRIGKRLFYNIRSGLLKSAGILIFFSVCLLIHTGLNAQGSLQFNTRIPGCVDARVTYLDGTPIIAGFTAQLF